jgi:hypothetical protein
MKLCELLRKNHSEITTEITKGKEKKNINGY